MSLFTPRFFHHDVEILSRESLYSGFFEMERIQLKHRLFEGGWSKVVSRELFVRNEAVCVLLYDPWQDCVVLIEQFRVGALAQESSPWLVELVAGIVEEGEADVDVASRESVEEAGAKVLALTPICNYHCSPGGSQEFVHLLCGKVDSTGLGGCHGLEAEGEDIRVMTVTRELAYAAVGQGRIINASTIMALQWLQLNWSKLQDQWISK